MFPNTNLIDLQPPATLAAIERETEDLGFDMPSVRETGALLRHLATQKLGSRVLELGTGTGLGSCWLLDGMDASSTLTTVDSDEQVLAIAKRHLGNDPRITILHMDAVSYLERSHTNKFDLIFADAWPGKFSHLEQALSLLAPSGRYFVDDLMPQRNWPAGHEARIEPFIESLREREGLSVAYKAWASGLLIARFE